MGKEVIFGENYSPSPNELSSRCHKIRYHALVSVDWSIDETRKKENHHHVVVFERHFSVSAFSVLIDTLQYTHPNEESIAVSLEISLECDVYSR